MPIRVKAFLIHLVLSIVIFSGAFLLATWLWYPAFYFSANGVWKVVRTVAIVDLALGPLMTLVLFKPGKPGLKFDLVMIAVLQISALTWGMWVLMSQRPVLTVFDQGIFYCLNPQQVDTAQAQLALLSKPSLAVAQAYLPPPADAQEEQQREQIYRQLPAGASGVPVYVFGMYFQPITPQIIPAMLPNEVVVTDNILQKYPAGQAAWEAFKTTYPDQAERFAYYPMSCSPEDHLAAVDRRSGLIVDAFPFPALATYKKRIWEKMQTP